MKDIQLLLLVLLSICCVGNIKSQTISDADLFGPNVYIFSPTDNMSTIQTTINNIHTAMLHDEFSTKRYAFYFKPGDYTQAGLFNIAYYTHIGGLGKTPYDVRISNVETPAPLPNNNATCTFWRSAENFTVAGTSTSDMNTWFQWAVSQAAPLRRINSERRAHYQWWYNGWCSGGFTGDCYFHDRAGSWSQQQWYFRNSYVELGSQDYSAGGWNLCYQGVTFGPKVNMASVSDNWTTSGGAWNNVSRVETTPIIREKPFLFIGDDGRYKVFRPAIRVNSKGPSWSTGNMGTGDTYDLINDFYVVKPGTTAETMNQQLAAGKHLFITPGLYELSEPLLVNLPNTIILGTGYATLTPGATDTTSAIIVGDVDGVTIASLLFDAHYNSRTLLQVGPKNAVNDHSANPTLLADLFFRVGGVVSTNVNVDISLEINSSDVIGDHFWIWRADHGQGVGWFNNTAKNGLVVNGNFVTIYGLFDEHYQQYGTLWNGEKGNLFFYQNETPYDVLKQSDYMSHNGTVKGYAAYKVADNVNYHNASMLGIYDVFVNTQGAQIAVANSMEVPNSKGVKVHNACDVRISTDNMGGFLSIINGQVPSTFYVNGAGSRFYIVDYTGTADPLPWQRPSQGGTTDVKLAEGNPVNVYPNPVVSQLMINTNEIDVRVEISDMTGKKLYSQAGINPISMESFAKGMYIVTVSSKNGVLKTVKVIK
jgi:hypothetical protein